MKKLILGPIVVVLLAGCYTPTQISSHVNIDLPIKDGHVFYENIVDVDSVLKDQLFERARMWAVDVFNNAKSVLQIADKETGQLSGKGIFNLQTNYRPVDFTFNIQFKDHKYRVQFYDFTFRAIDPVNGRSLERSADSVYFNYKNGVARRDVFQTQIAAQERDKGYLLLFKDNVSSLMGSLQSYENGSHKTEF